VTVTAPGIANTPPVPSDAFDDLTCNLTTIGVSEEQARAELQTYRDSPEFAAGHVKDMRFNVNRACLLLVALGEEKEGLLGELWAEWQADDPARKILAWSTVRGSEIQSFARHVQGFLRAR
jgi:hypothetical protein